MSLNALRLWKDQFKQKSTEHYISCVMRPIEKWVWMDFFKKNIVNGVVALITLSVMFVSCYYLGFNVVVILAMIFGGVPTVEFGADVFAWCHQRRFRRSWAQHLRTAKDSEWVRLFTKGPYDQFKELIHQPQYEKQGIDVKPYLELSDQDLMELKARIDPALFKELMAVFKCENVCSLELVMDLIHRHENRERIGLEEQRAKASAGLRERLSQFEDHSADVSFSTPSQSNLDTKAEDSQPVMTLSQEDDLLKTHLPRQGTKMEPALVVDSMQELEAIQLKQVQLDRLAEVTRSR